MLDVYRQSDAREVRDTLETVLGPGAGSSWSTGGVYVFWHPVSRLPLYVGITGDFPVRFAQHNDLRACPSAGCKREQIARYFAEEHDQLGFTVLAISHLSQPSTARQREVLDLDDRELIDLNEALSNDVVNEMRALEGRLIADSQARFGNLPPWNTAVGRIPSRGGDVADLTMAVAVGAVDTLLQARRTIRELAADNLSELFEAQLHGARLLSVARAARGGKGIRNDMIREDLENNWGILAEIRGEILRTGYLDARCPVTVGPKNDGPP